MASEQWVVPAAPEGNPPLVSVLIPSHRPAFLAEAVASVRSQTVPRSTYQILVNESEDWYTNKINDLARIARGKFLLILPDDDCLEPTYLEKCLPLAQLGADIVYTDIQFFGDLTTIRRMPSFGLNTFRHATCPWMTALVRKSLWEEIGGHAPGVIYQDTVFWIECAKRGAEAAHVREPLLLARQHASQGAKMLDHSTAALQLHSRYPEIYPSPFDSPPDPRAPHDGRGVVPPVFLPPHLRPVNPVGV